MAEEIVSVDGPLKVTHETVGMEWRLVVLAVLLAMAGIAAVIGVAQLSIAAAWIVAGVLAAVWAWLFFGEAGE